MNDDTTEQDIKQQIQDWLDAGITTPEQFQQYLEMIRGPRVEQLDDTPPEKLTDAEAFERLLTAIDVGNKDELAAFGGSYRRIGARASSIHPCERKMLLEIIYDTERPAHTEESCKSFRGGKAGHILVPEKLGPWLRRGGFYLEGRASEKDLALYDHDGTVLCTGHADNYITNRVFRAVAEIKTMDLNRVRAVNSWKDFATWWEVGYRAQLLLYMTMEKGGYWGPMFEDCVCARCEEIITSPHDALHLLGGKDIECESCGLARGFEHGLWVLTDCRKEYKVIPIMLDEENRAYVRYLIEALRRLKQALALYPTGKNYLDLCPMTTNPVHCSTCWLKQKNLCPGIAADLSGLPIITETEAVSVVQRMSEIAVPGQEYMKLCTKADRLIKKSYREATQVERVIVGEHSIFFKRGVNTVHEYPREILERRKAEDKQYTVKKAGEKVKMIFEFAGQAEPEPDDEGEDEPVPDAE